MEKQSVPEPDQGASPEQEEMYRRVWARVMGERGPEREEAPGGRAPARPDRPPERPGQSPQRPGRPPEQPSQRPGRPPERPGQPGTPPPLPGGLRPVPPPQPPVPLPQLGEGSRDYAPLLRELMEREGELRLSQQALARRTQGIISRSLGSMAAEHLHAQQQLGAVYFILTGQRPRVSLDPQSLPGETERALRELFLREQRLQLAYREGSRRTQDPCLAALFRELGETCQENMDALRRLLERV